MGPNQSLAQARGCVTQTMSVTDNHVTHSPGAWKCRTLYFASGKLHLKSAVQQKMLPALEHLLLMKGNSIIKYAIH